MLPLSPLSRGHGKWVQNKQKVEVYFEPEDYLNWKSPEDYVLVCKPQDKGDPGTQHTWSLLLPKTFSTRKGVLILYSEGLAWTPGERRKGPCRPQGHRKRLGPRWLPLRDLREAILAQERTQDMSIETHRRLQVSEENRNEKTLQTSRRACGCDHIDHAWLMSDKPHSTFHGNSFPNRNADLSDKHGDMKLHMGGSSHWSQEPPAERCLFPPVASATASEKHTPGEVKKKASKTSKLPPISQEPPGAQDPLRSRFKTRESPAELLIFPAEIHFHTRHPSKEKMHRGGAAESGPDTEEPSAPRRPPLKLAPSDRPAELTAPPPVDTGRATLSPQGGGAAAQKVTPPPSLMEGRGSPEGQRGPDGLRSAGHGSPAGPRGTLPAEGPANAESGTDLDMIFKETSPLTQKPKKQEIEGEGDCREEAGGPLRGDHLYTQDPKPLITSWAENIQRRKPDTVQKAGRDYDAIHLHRRLAESGPGSPESLGAVDTPPLPKEKEGKTRPRLPKQQTPLSPSREEMELTDNVKRKKRTRTDKSAVPRGEREGKVRREAKAVVGKSKDSKAKKKPELIPKGKQSGVKRKRTPKERSRETAAEPSGSEASSSPGTEGAPDRGSLPSGLGAEEPRPSPGAAGAAGAAAQESRGSNGGRPPPAPAVAVPGSTEPEEDRSPRDPPEEEMELADNVKRKKRTQTDKSAVPRGEREGKVRREAKAVVGKSKDSKAKKKPELIPKGKQSGVKRKRTPKERSREAAAEPSGSEASSSPGTEGAPDRGSLPSGLDAEESQPSPGAAAQESRGSNDGRPPPAPAVAVPGHTEPEEDRSPRDPPEDLQAKREQEKALWDRQRMERAQTRRLAVERKRKEQEEQRRLQQKQLERAQKMEEELEQQRRAEELELELEQRRRAEETRLRKQKQEEEQQRQEEKERQQQAAQEKERARQLQEVLRRRLQALQRKKQLEEVARAEAEKQKQQELELQLAEEHRSLMEMAEEERLEFQGQKQESEEKARLGAEERRQQKEEAARLILEKAMKQAQEGARQKSTLRKPLHFYQELRKEANGLQWAHNISRPWVYSYFQFLQTPRP